MGQPARNIRLRPILADLLRLKASAWLFAGPSLVFALGYLAAWKLFAPTITDTFRQDHSDFFTTSAQVIAGGLVTLAIEARVFQASGATFARNAASLGFVYVVVGLVSAVVALAPGHSDWLYREAFNLTIAAGLATAAAVTLTGLYTIRTGSLGREQLDRGRRGA